MEFYSERCQDWLDRSPNVHPDKLRMEVSRFQTMLEQHESQRRADHTVGSESEELQEDEVAEDLALTVQLLQERLVQLTGIKSTSLQSEKDISDQLNQSEAGKLVLTDVNASDTAPLSTQAPDLPLQDCQLSEAPLAQDETWDTSSLSDPLGVEVEHLDEETRQARKQALLDIPGISLGVKGLKQT